MLLGVWHQVNKPKPVYTIQNKPVDFSVLGHGNVFCYIFNRSACVFVCEEKNAGINSVDTNKLHRNGMQLLSGDQNS